MIVCPTCQAENDDDVVVCETCEGALERIVGSLPANKEPIGELHTVELPGAGAAGPLQFEERAMRRSSRPPPPAQVSRMSSRPPQAVPARVSSRPPPRSPSHPPPRAPSHTSPPATSEPSGVERVLDLLATPIDRLVVRAPGRELTLGKLVGAAAILGALCFAAAWLLGGVEGPIGPSMRLTSSGRAVLGIPLLSYLILAMVTLARDRLRAARPR